MTHDGGIDSPAEQAAHARWTAQFSLGTILLLGACAALAGLYDDSYFFGSPALPVKWFMVVVGLAGGFAMLAGAIRSVGLRQTPSALLRSLKRYKVATAVIILVAAILAYNEHSQRSYMEEMRSIVQADPTPPE